MEKNGLPTQLEKTADIDKDKSKLAATRFRETESDQLFNEALKAQKSQPPHIKVAVKDDEPK